MLSKFMSLDMLLISITLVSVSMSADGHLTPLSKLPMSPMFCLVQHCFSLAVSITTLVIKTITNRHAYGMLERIES